ncbi:MAG: hypothetical protein ACREN6_09690 [Gemmatimonadaceae bacterium]
MKTLKAAVLDSAGDDYTGLWEVLWLVKQRRPEQTDSVAREQARSLVLEMLHDRLLLLYEGVEFNGDEKRVQSSQWEQSLDVVTYWGEPLGDMQQMRVVATEQGERE